MDRLRRRDPVMLKKVDISGGAALPLCESMGEAGAPPGDGTDSIIFATAETATGLQRVSSNGGEIEGAHETQPRARGKRSPLAAVLARQPSRSLHDHPRPAASTIRRWRSSTWRTGT